MSCYDTPLANAGSEITIGGPPRWTTDEVRDNPILEITGQRISRWLRGD